MQYKKPVIPPVNIRMNKIIPNKRIPNRYPPYKAPKIKGIQRRSQTNPLSKATGTNIHKTMEITGKRLMAKPLYPLTDMHI